MPNSLDVNRLAMYGERLYTESMESDTHGTEETAL